jgi:KTSC domain-containing protein
MERTLVESSNLASVGYDRTSATLEIEFRKSGVYQYFGVPHSTYEELMNAGLKGTYFDQNIKKGGFSYSKVG